MPVVVHKIKKVTTIFYSFMAYGEHIISSCGEDISWFDEKKRSYRWKTVTCKACLNVRMK